MSKKTFKDYILDNVHSNRMPVKISIEFKHRKFKGNKGFAILDDPTILNKVFHVISKSVIKPDREEKPKLYLNAENNTEVSDLLLIFDKSGECYIGRMLKDDFSTVFYDRNECLTIENVERWEYINNL